MAATTTAPKSRESRKKLKPKPKTESKSWQTRNMGQSARRFPTFRWPHRHSLRCARRRKATAAVISRRCGRDRMPADAGRSRPPISRGN